MLRRVSMPSCWAPVSHGIDVTERKRAEEGQRVLVAELDHRVKNALATVSAVISHTRQGARTIGGFVDALEGRIRSMATTRELLSSRPWQQELPSSRAA